MVPLDISFNELLGEPQEIWISDKDSLLAYFLVDLVAEKYRALLQQKNRQRNRRQDVYDLEFLLRHYRDELSNLQSEIFKAFTGKSKSRNLSPSPKSIDEPIVRECASTDWDTLKPELGSDRYRISTSALKMLLPFTGTCPGRRLNPQVDRFQSPPSTD